MDTATVPACFAHRRAGRRRHRWFLFDPCEPTRKASGELRLLFFEVADAACAFCRRQGEQRFEQAVEHALVASDGRVHAGLGLRCLMLCHLQNP
jgi:hypothetical protein